MDLTTRRALIDRYHSGYDAVIAALDGITAEEMDRSSPGEWSSRQIVHHLADAETNSYLRLRKLLAEDDTVIQAYDENLWARQSWYGGPIEGSLAVVKAVRESTGALLESMDENQWARIGTHSVSGPFPATTWLEWYAAHPHDHADQIRRARNGYTEV
jgi:DinB superfamily